MNQQKLAKSVSLNKTDFIMSIKIVEKDYFNNLIECCVCVYFDIIRIKQMPSLAIIKQGLCNGATLYSSLFENQKLEFKKACATFLPSLFKGIFCIF